MRPSSHLLVPALTILCWSLESVYASFRPSGQSLYRRQFRTADYSTSTRPLSYPSNASKKPDIETSPSSRLGPDTSQTSSKTRRSLSYYNKSRLSGSAHPQEKRHSYRDPTDIEGYHGSHPDHGCLYAQPFSRRTSPPTSAGHNLPVIRVRDAFHKSTTSSAAQHESHTNEDMTSHLLGKKFNVVPRSTSIDLSTLHIARSLQKYQPTAKSSVEFLPQDGVVPLSTNAPYGKRE